MTYIIESIVQDASIKKVLHKALSDDGRLSYDEVKLIVSSALDGRGRKFSRV